jgi:hypothetical protein
VLALIWSAVRMPAEAVWKRSHDELTNAEADQERRQDFLGLVGSGDVELRLAASCPSPAGSGPWSKQSLQQIQGSPSADASMKPKRSHSDQSRCAPHRNAKI